MELLWETVLQQAYYKNGEVDSRIKLRCNIGKYMIAGAQWDKFSILSTG
jgi:hypothetical protein